MKYLKLKSPFLERIFPPTFLLSTSQTPLNQCGDEVKHVNLDRQKFATAGGGFGPVDDNGYGVSYIVVGEDILSFHISSKRSASNTVCLVFFLKLYLKQISKKFQSSILQQFRCNPCFEYYSLLDFFV